MVVENEAAESGEGTAKIIQKLEAALNADGDFPIRARVVSELRKLVNDPNTPIEKIVELILGEPALGTRILHLVNSVYYQRRHPVMTVSQAVMQLGMRALTDLCTGLVLLRRFSPIAKRGGIFADNVKKCILTSLLTSMLSRETSDEEEERGYLAGTFFSIGPLLLAYYFPQVFEAAEQRASRRGQTTTQSITETLGISPVALSLGIVDALAIPQYYRDLLINAYSIYVGEADHTQTGMGHTGVENALATAGRLSDAIIDTETRPELSAALDTISTTSGFNHDHFDKALSRIPVSFKKHCQMIEMSFLELPEHFVTYMETRDNPDLDQYADDVVTEDQFSYYTDEIKEAIASEETMSSIITSAMEALAFGLKFDRVLLLFSDPAEGMLEGRMALGESFGIDPHSFRRPIVEDEDEPGPDVNAFLEGDVEIYGDPLFENGWPFAAIPIGTTERTIGVIYADMVAKPESEDQALNEGTQVALNILADLLDKALAVNS